MNRTLCLASMLLAIAAGSFCGCGGGVMSEEEARARVAAEDAAEAELRSLSTVERGE